jgi:hypothetical protein
MMTREETIKPLCSNITKALRKEDHCTFAEQGLGPRLRQTRKNLRIYTKISINVIIVPAKMSENVEESGAIIYVAITVMAFVFLVLVAVWIMTRKKRKRYNPVKADTEGDSVELVKNVEKKTNEFTIEEEDSEEDIELYSDNLEDPSLEAV